jgi:hypothetical protein
MESTREPDLRAAGELTVVLLAHADGPELAGAELAVGVGWLGLRSHPRPASTFTLGGAAIPDWFDDVLREVLR